MHRDKHEEEENILFFLLISKVLKTRDEHGISQEMTRGFVRFYRECDLVTKFLCDLMRKKKNLNSNAKYT